MRDIRRSRAAERGAQVVSAASGGDPDGVLDEGDIDQLREAFDQADRGQSGSIMAADLGIVLETLVSLHALEPAARILHRPGFPAAAGLRSCVHFLCCLPS